MNIQPAGDPTDDKTGIPQAAPGVARMSGPTPRPDPAPSPAPDDPERRAFADAHQAAMHETFGQTMRALGRIVGSFTPWLIEFGSWIFAGLIAFTLIILAALITVGPVDPSILVATTAFALALPVNLAGLIILRLIQDMQRIGFSAGVAQSFQEAGLPMDEPGTAPEQQALRVRRTNLVLLYALVLLLVSAVLTLAAIVAALWHMAWWIAVAFLIVLVLCLGGVLLALVTVRPPDTPAQRARYQRYWETLLARAREEQTYKR